MSTREAVRISFMKKKEKVPIFTKRWQCIFHEILTTKSEI